MLMTTQQLFEKGDKVRRKADYFNDWWMEHEIPNHPIWEVLHDQNDNGDVVYINCVGVEHSTWCSTYASYMELVSEDTPKNPSKHYRYINHVELVKGKCFGIQALGNIKMIAMKNHYGEWDLYHVGCAKPFDSDKNQAVLMDRNNIEPIY